MCCWLFLFFFYPNWWILFLTWVLCSGRQWRSLLFRRHANEGPMMEWTTFFLSPSPRFPLFSPPRKNYYDGPPQEEAWTGGESFLKLFNLENILGKRAHVLHPFQKAAALHETLKTARTGVWKSPPIKLLKATWNPPPKKGGSFKICDSHFAKPLLIRPQLLFVRIPFLGQKGKGRRWVTLRLLPFCVASKQCKTFLLSFPSCGATDRAFYSRP